MENNNSTQPQINDVINDDSESFLLDLEVVELEFDEAELEFLLLDLDCLCFDLFRWLFLEEGMLMESTGFSVSCFQFNAVVIFESLYLHKQQNIFDIPKVTDYSSSLISIWVYTKSKSQVCLQLLLSFTKPDNKYVVTTRIKRCG